MLKALKKRAGALSKSTAKLSRDALGQSQSLKEHESDTAAGLAATSRTLCQSQPDLGQQEGGMCWSPEMDRPSNRKKRRSFDRLWHFNKRSPQKSILHHGQGQAASSSQNSPQLNRRANGSPRSVEFKEKEEIFERTPDGASYVDLQFLPGGRANSKIKKNSRQQQGMADGGHEMSLDLRKQQWFSDVMVRMRHKSGTGSTPGSVADLTKAVEQNGNVHTGMSKDDCSPKALPNGNAPTFRRLTMEVQKIVEKNTDATKETVPVSPTGITKDSVASDSSDHSRVVSYLAEINLKEGKDLVIRDASGSSDPYVKFKHKSKIVFKSNTIFKNLNPEWNETFTVIIDELTTPMQVEVFDFDRFASDDFMGQSEIDFVNLRLRATNDIKLLLCEEGNDEYMGYVLLSVTLTPQTAEEKENFLKQTARDQALGQARKAVRGSLQSWTSVVNIVLVEAKNLLPTDYRSSTPLPDPYVKFKLGNEKYKSKVAFKTLDPKWREQFDLHVFDEQNQLLELMIFDRQKNLFMGRCTVDLATVERETTSQEWYPLDDGAGQVMLLLTITGTTGADTVSDMQAYESQPSDKGEMITRYDWMHSLTNVKDVGMVRVKVFKAQGLASADIGGKSDPFCVLELVNARLQTHTEFKTLNPEWNKVFTFNVKDIHSLLEVTIYDEDPNKKAEFLGKVGIPLLKIRNGEKRWYALKDRKLRRRAKGQILLELELFFNKVKASVRTFNPRETKYVVPDQKFKRQVFMRNINRLKQFAMAQVEVGEFIASCFNWESKLRSSLAFLTFMLVTYFFELYMLPLVLLTLFVRAFVAGLFAGKSPGGSRGSADNEELYYDSDEEEMEVPTAESPGNAKTEQSKSLKERMQALNDVLLMLQNVLDLVASSIERVKNTFNFTTPFLSWLAIVVLSAATVVLYFVPVRWLIMAWGVNKFTKKLRNPHAIPNNELLDFLSRVPSDTELRLWGEFRPEPVDRMPQQYNRIPTKRLS